MILKSFKYRLYPNKAQEVLIKKSFGSTRFIYNWGLNKRIQLYTTSKESISTIELTNLMKKELKDSEEYSWLNDIHSQVLQQSLRNLDQAYTRFFREKKGFPKFKKKNSRQSFSYPQGVKTDFKNSKIFLPKLKWTRVVFDREFEGTIKTCTVSSNTCGQYFVSVLVELDQELPQKPEIREETTIGIDLGLKDFCILSDGRKIENPRFYRKSEKKLKRHQKLLSRKILGSKNRKKEQKKLAKISLKISNQRTDFLHKLSFQLTHESQVDSIVIESLNVKGMVKNHCLAKSIQDASWSSFTSMLEYKCSLYGKNLIKIGRFEPSSQVCSDCGYRHIQLQLSDRSWICPECRNIHDRDLNASKNIKNFGLSKNNLVGPERPKLTPLETSSMDDRQNSTDLRSTLSLKEESTFLS